MTMSLPTHSLQLRSLVTPEGELEISLRSVPVPQPGEGEVLVQIEAAPINPSDLALLVGPADVEQGKTEGSGAETVWRAPIPEGMRGVVKAREGESAAVGNEAAGTVVAAGSSEAAQALLGRTVAIVGGEMFAQHRVVNAFMAIPMEEGTAAREAASSFVNPLTALGMVETMKAENHKALVHTAAASNLGQMLVKLCQADDIPLVNIVRKPEQEEILRDLGAEYVVNSSSSNFRRDLVDAIQATEATLAFDATGGGDLANSILGAMEQAAAAGQAYNRYGSDVFKQLYIYGRLDLSPVVLTAAYGFSWSIGGWLLTPFLQKIGMERMAALQQRVAREIKTTFSSQYAGTLSLPEALQADNVRVYARRATGEKYLIEP
ncbi:MAG: NADH oxidase [bacterium TMED88]|nr:NADH oxidase [Deltaproteobacteria bacterium]OUV22669.1 MAG: NADH oxidase [bacterium TMED88]